MSTEHRITRIIKGVVKDTTRSLSRSDALLLVDEIKALREKVLKADELPLAGLQVACALIEYADDQAMAAEDNIPPTAQVLTAAELQNCLSAIWACKEPIAAYLSTDPVTKMEGSD